MKFPGQMNGRSTVMLEAFLRIFNDLMNLIENLVELLKYFFGIFSRSENLLFIWFFQEIFTLLKKYSLKFRSQIRKNLLKIP